MSRTPQHGGNEADNVALVEERLVRTIKNHLFFIYVVYLKKKKAAKLVYDAIRTTRYVTN